MIYVIDEKVYSALPEDAKSAIDDGGACIEDEGKEAEIAELAGMPQETQEEEKGEPIEYGKENEHKGFLDEEGSMKEMPESEKNKIKDFGEAGDRSMDFIVAIGKKDKAEKLNKVNPIAKKETKDEEAKKAEPSPKYM